MSAAPLRPQAAAERKDTVSRDMRAGRPWFAKERVCAKDARIVPPRGRGRFEMPATKFRYLLLTAALLGGGGIAPCRGQAAPPVVMPARYQVDVWQGKEGLPQNTVDAIARTADGYLWLGTAEGLVRFDGVRFTVFDLSIAPELGNSSIKRLLADRTGALWIGNSGPNLVRYQDGRFTRFTAQHGWPDDLATAFCEADDGGLWIGTYAHGLYRWKDGALMRAAAPLSGVGITALARDGAGGLWVGTATGLAHLRGEEVTRQELASPGEDRSIRALCGDRAGVLWVGTSQGLSRVPAVGARAESVGAGAPRSEIWAVAEDRAGTLWVGSLGGSVLQGTDGRFAPCPLQADLPPYAVMSFLETPEGDLWVGLNGGGLARLRRGRIGVYNERDGLDGTSVYTVCGDAEGVCWVRTQNGLNRIRDGRIEPCPPGENGLPATRVTALANDREGRLLAATNNPPSIHRFAGGRFEPVATAGALVLNLLVDRGGGLWMGGWNGLERRAPNGEPAPPAPNEPGRSFIAALREDREGGVWVAASYTGIHRFHQGRFSRWTTEDGLPTGQILSFYEDRSGAMWIGTHGSGLVRYKDGRFVTITSRDGLYDNLAFAIVEDASATCG